MAELLTILFQLALVSVALGVLTAMVAEAVDARVPSVGKRYLRGRSTPVLGEHSGAAPSAARARRRTA